MTDLEVITGGVGVIQVSQNTPLWGWTVWRVTDLSDYADQPVTLNINLLFHVIWLSLLFKLLLHVLAFIVIATEEALFLTGLKLC